MADNQNKSGTPTQTQQSSDQTRRGPDAQDSQNSKNPNTAGGQPRNDRKPSERFDADKKGSDAKGNDSNAEADDSCGCDSNKMSGSKAAQTRPTSPGSNQ